MGAGLVAFAVLGLLGAAAASASIEVAYDASQPALQVDSRGNALVSWTAQGTRRTLLVPAHGEVLPGGHLSGPDVSRAASVPGLPVARVVRRTADGRFWALQEWQPVAGGPRQLDFSRWSGEPTKVTLARDGKRLVGTATFQGRPLPPFSPTPEGKHVRTFVFVDCLGCPASRTTWRRLLGVAPKADGSFRFLLRPDWTGKRYRATVAGPNIGATLAPDARALT
jgi:hypothetical protein